MSFSPVKNVRIGSLTQGAVVQLRLGKAAAKSSDDVIVEVRLVRHHAEGDKSLVTFEETASDGQKTELTISRFPGASWRSGTQYVSLISVDESTFTIQRAASPIQTDVIGEAISLVVKEAEDVYASEQLIALLSQIQNGTRVNTEVKFLAIQYAKRLVDELSNLPAKDAEATTAE